MDKLNPFLIARHGPRPNMIHELIPGGEQDVIELGEAVKSLLGSYASLCLCYGDTEHGSYGAISQTAEILGEQLGIKPERKEYFCVQEDEIWNDIPQDRLEGMTKEFEELQAKGPVMCITNDRIIKGLAPYIDKKYGFDVGLQVKFVNFASGFMFKFDPKKILYLPKGFEIE